MVFIILFHILIRATTTTTANNMAQKQVSLNLAKKDASVQVGAEKKGSLKRAFPDSAVRGSVKKQAKKSDDKKLEIESGYFDNAATGKSHLWMYMARKGVKLNFDARYTFQAIERLCYLYMEDPPVEDLQYARNALQRCLDMVNKDEEESEDEGETVEGNFSDVETDCA